MGDDLFARCTTVRISDVNGCVPTIKGTVINFLESAVEERFICIINHGYINQVRQSYGSLAAYLSFAKGLL